MEHIMTEFVGYAGHTLIVEKNDSFAAKWERILKRFPKAIVSRVKTAEEAVLKLEALPNDILRVCVCGEIYAPAQALHGLLGVVETRKQERATSPAG